MSKLARGYDIRIQRDDSGWLSEKRHAWGLDGKLTDEWQHIKHDQSVVRAIIFHSRQRNRRAEKRRSIEEYARS